MERKRLTNFRMSQKPHMRGLNRVDIDPLHFSGASKSDNPAAAAQMTPTQRQNGGTVTREWIAFAFMQGKGLAASPGSARGFKLDQIFRD